MVPDDVHADLSPDDRVLRGLLGDMHRERRRATVRRRLGALAAGLTLVAGTFVLTHALDDHPGGPPRRPPVTVTAADPGTGVRAELGTTEHDWGTEVALDLHDDQGPRECALVVVDRTGLGRTIGSWTVSAPTGQPVPATVSITAVTALRLPGIDHFEVRSSTGQTLLTLRP